MHDPRTVPGTAACGAWAESVSLLAAGCLEPSTEPSLRRHMAACPACAARFADLAWLARSLEAAAPDAVPHAESIRARSAARLARRDTLPPWNERSAARAAPWLVGGVAAAAGLWLVVPWADVPSRSVPTASRSAVSSSTQSPPPLAGPPVAAPRMPLLAAYELALAESDAGFDAVLARRAGPIAFQSSAPRVLVPTLAEEVSR